MQRKAEHASTTRSPSTHTAYRNLDKKWMSLDALALDGRASDVDKINDRDFLFSSTEREKRMREPGYLFSKDVFSKRLVMCFNYIIKYYLTRLLCYCSRMDTKRTSSKTQRRRYIIIYIHAGSRNAGIHESDASHPLQGTGSSDHFS